MMMYLSWHEIIGQLKHVVPEGKSLENIIKSCQKTILQKEYNNSLRNKRPSRFPYKAITVMQVSPQNQRALLEVGNLKRQIQSCRIPMNTEW